jgi:hypothetical protein
VAVPWSATCGLAGLALARTCLILWDVRPLGLARVVNAQSRQHYRPRGNPFVSAKTLHVLPCAETISCRLSRPSDSSGRPPQRLNTPRRSWVTTAHTGPARRPEIAVFFFRSPDSCTRGTHDVFPRLLLLVLPPHLTSMFNFRSNHRLHLHWQASNPSPFHSASTRANLLKPLILPEHQVNHLTALSYS